MFLLLRLCQNTPPPTHPQLETYVVVGGRFYITYKTEYNIVKKFV